MAAAYGRVAGRYCQSRTLDSEHRWAIFARQATLRLGFRSRSVEKRQATPGLSKWNDRSWRWAEAVRAGFRQKLNVYPRGCPLAAEMSATLTTRSPNSASYKRAQCAALSAFARLQSSEVDSRGERLCCHFNAWTTIVKTFGVKRSLNCDGRRVMQPKPMAQKLGANLWGLCTELERIQHCESPMCRAGVPVYSRRACGLSEDP